MLENKENVQNSNIKALEMFLLNHECFTTVPEGIKCRYCNYKCQNIDYKTKFLLNQHIETTSHVERVLLEKERKIIFDKGELNSEKFDELLIKWINSVNISYDAINNPATKEFFKFLGFKLKGSDYYLNVVNERMLNKRFYDIHDCLNAFPFAVFSMKALLME